MMLHRHFEEDKAKRQSSMTRLSDVSPSDSTNPNDALYVPVDGNKVEGKPPRREGRAKKTN